MQEPAGSWRHRKWWLGALAVLAFLIVATGIKAIHNTLQENPKTGPDYYSWSVAESRRKGTLIYELEAEPTEIVCNGITIRFREIWLEERAIEGHAFVWFAEVKRLGGYDLCFTLADGIEAFRGAPSAEFVVGDNGGSFGSRFVSDGTHVFHVGIKRKEDVFQPLLGVRQKGAEAKGIRLVLKRN